MSLLLSRCPSRDLPRRLRALGASLTLAGLAACAGKHTPHAVSQVSEVQEARRYAARAAHDYTPPGSPEDPWAPYITEASQRFDVPERWIREVMRQESGGHLFNGAGSLTTSPVGAMGLMQVMPETYDMLASRYELGDDAYDPHNNILAGTAYIRELYDLYGSPGFLAAYNAGPGRLDDYLTRNRPLPLETRRYVASIGPHIRSTTPNSPSPVEQYAMNAMPTDIPEGPRYNSDQVTAPIALASADTTVPVQASFPTATRPAPQVRMASATTVAHTLAVPAPFRAAPMQVAQLPEPPVPHTAPAQPLAQPLAPQIAQQMAQAAPPLQFQPQAQPSGRHGLHLIPSAMAEPMPLPASVRHSTPTAMTGDWAVQVGAYGNEALARAAATAARGSAGSALASARTNVGSVKQGHSTLYRARLTGLSRDAATQACEKLSKHGGCMVLSPEGQS